MTLVTIAAASADELDRVLAAGTLRSVLQPIVDLEYGAVVAFEALVRGPEGPSARPDQVFAAARAHDRLVALDPACRLSALTAASRHSLFDPALLFVNVAPEVLDTAPLADLLAVMAEAAGDLRVVLQVTERALTTRPAGLLATVERVRSLGWGVPLDDVGAYAERSGAVVLAEGIEMQEHVVMAKALSATLGQGWHLGRPAEVPDLSRPVMALAVPSPPSTNAPSPSTALPPGTVLRCSPEQLLVEVSQRLEREALRIGGTAVITSTLQHPRCFTPSTTARYRDLAERVGFVCALGEGMPEEPVPGVPAVRGVDVPLEDPILGEWDVAVVGPHFAGALLARDLGDIGIEGERMLEHALTYDRDVVVAAARSLMSRVVAPPAPVHDAHGALVQLVGVQTDGTARVEAQQALALERDRSVAYGGRIESLARTDALTGLLDRSSLTEAFELALWDARAAGDSLVVALCDVDGFRALNEDHGNAMGDAVLAEVAVRLRRRVRRADLLARLGSDQFLVVLTGLHGSNAEQIAGSFAEAVHKAMGEPVETALGPLDVRVSVGTCGHPGDGDDASTLIRAAEAAMIRTRRETVASRR